MFYFRLFFAKKMGIQPLHSERVSCIPRLEVLECDYSFPNFQRKVVALGISMFTIPIIGPKIPKDDAG